MSIESVTEDWRYLEAVDQTETGSAVRVRLTVVAGAHLVPFRGHLFDRIMLAQVRAHYAAFAQVLIDHVFAVGNLYAGATQKPDAQRAGVALLLIDLEGRASLVPFCSALPCANTVTIS